MTDGLHFEAFRAKMRKQAPEAEQAAMTIAEQLRQEGEARGRVKERVAMLTKLLTLKFGPLSSEHERVISEASAEQLEQYVERVVRAARLDDVFAE